MNIEKYTIFIKDPFTKKSSKITLEGNYPHDVHKSALSKIKRYQEIEKMVDASGSLVYNSEEGFKW